MSWIYAALPFVILIIIFIALGIHSLGPSSTQSRVEETTYSGKFIYFRDFEDAWITHKSGSKALAGYKQMETPGCYVILIFDKKVIGNDLSHYENVYVGQSINLTQRVHNHFNGKGKGDVYADIKYGKQAYVQLVPCKKEKLNATEKRLIEKFDATNSYNRTRGGAKLS